MDFIARLAALESVCYQTHDLLQAMIVDGAQAPSALRVDGGMVVNDWLVQRLADISGVSVERPDNIESTAIGAARLAGLQAGVYQSLAEMSSTWRLVRRADPNLDEQQRRRHLSSWSAAVNAVRRYADEFPPAATGQVVKWRSSCPWPGRDKTRS